MIVVPDASMLHYEWFAREQCCGFLAQGFWQALSGRGPAANSMFWSDLLHGLALPFLLAAVGAAVFFLAYRREHAERISTDFMA